MSCLSQLFGQQEDSEPAKPPHPTPTEGGTHLPGTRIYGRYEAASHPLMVGMGLVYIGVRPSRSAPRRTQDFQPRVSARADCARSFPV